MKNDHKGRIIHNRVDGFDTFYASGATGHPDDIRADGKGGLLARGYYWNTPTLGTHGPFSCRRNAANRGIRALKGV